MRTVLLLIASNIFMTAAWYGHLRFRQVALWKVILIAWGIAFFEYCLQVPANRLGYGDFSAAQLKIVQEVITLVVFIVFAWLWLDEHLRWNEALWNLLRGGGHVVLIRHAATDRGTGDPPGFRLDDCTTQRNLSARGREDARRMGDTFRARGVPVATVLSSRWCRCLETARLAFSTVEPWPALDSMFEDKSRSDEQARAFREKAGTRPANGNVVLVSHGVNITAWTGVPLAQGDLVVLAPSGKGTFRVAGTRTTAVWN